MSCDKIREKGEKKKKKGDVIDYLKQRKKKKRNVPLSKAAGLIVPDPSTRSPATPFIGAEWEVSYMAGQGMTARTSQAEPSQSLGG